MTMKEQLEKLYIQLGESTGPVDEELLNEIWRLEALLAPTPEPEPEPELVNYCGAIGCNGSYCWDCAAIRGGCPEDV